MKSILAIVLIGISISGCTSHSDISTATAGSYSSTEEQRHRLYAAALAASESPLESETFREVCKKIGIFDAHSNQNGNYGRFVTAHLEWAMKTETEQFKREINTQEKARQYLIKHFR